MNRPGDRPRLWRFVGANRRLLVFLGIFFLAGMASSPVSSLLPVYVEKELHQPAIFTSSILATQLFVGGLFAVLGGALADGIGQRRALLFGLAGLPLASAVFLVGQPLPMALMVGLRGATDGLQSAGSQAYLVVGTPAGWLGLATALFFLGNTVGSSLGNLIAGLIVSRYGFQALSVAFILVSLLVVATAARFLGDVAGAPRSRGGVASNLRGYGELLRRREVQFLSATRFLPTCYWGVMTLLMPLLIYRLSQNVLVVSQYAAVSLLLAAGCQLLTGRIVDRVSRTAPPVVLTALIPICGLLAALSARSLPALFAVGVLGTCVAWSLSATLPSLVREIAGPAEEGRILGYLHLIWSIAMLGGTLLGGAIVDLDPSLPFAVVAVLNVPTALATWLLSRAIARKKRLLSAESGSLQTTGKNLSGR